MNLLRSASLPTGADEIFETLLARPGVEIERIVSNGQTTPAGEYYDQSWDEWVLLLQGRARLDYAEGGSQELSAGDSLLIPARRRHRVGYTSQDPPCIWLALHFKPPAA